VLANNPETLQLIPLAANSAQRRTDGTGEPTRVALASRDATSASPPHGRGDTRHPVGGLLRLRPAQQARARLACIFHVQ